MNKRFLLTNIALAVSSALLPSLASAQDFPPKRPVTMFVGFAPGGAADAAARLIAKKLTENMGQNVIVENKAGAGGNIVHQQVANGVEPWTGVRNHLAKKNLMAMKKGDLAFFYHSNIGKEVVGVVEVAREAYPDPTAEEGSSWVCVDMRAVAPMPHDIKGQALYAFVTLKDGVAESEHLKKALANHVRKEIGAIAVPDKIQFAPGLPKTRSGKIMRRILRKIAEGDVSNLGDTSTLADPSVVDALVSARP